MNLSSYNKNILINLAVNEIKDFYMSAPENIKSFQHHIGYQKFKNHPLILNL